MAYCKVEITIYIMCFLIYINTKSILHTIFFTIAQHLVSVRL